MGSSTSKVTSPKAHAIHPTNQVVEGAPRDWAAGLPLTRDLTDEAENLQVLALASEILASGISLQSFKDEQFGNGNKEPGPTVLVSAISSAESKLKLKALGPLHMTCIYAMYGEQNRIKKKAEHPNGQDFVRMKVKQLEWLFDGEVGKTWEILAVDDGCPNDSKSLAKAVIQAEGYTNVHVLDLEDAVKEGMPYFKERGLTAGCKQSRKGGAILYGLHYAATQPAPGTAPKLVMYTDSDLSTDMSLCGLLADGLLAQGSSMSMGARYGQAETFLVKPPTSGPAGHPQSHFEQPNMMKIVMRHWVRVRLLPMLKGIYDTQCAFKCFRAEDVLAIIGEVRGLGADFDMELLLCALSHFRNAGVPDGKLCGIAPTLFTEDFAESNFMATSDDPDKSYKTFAAMTNGMCAMHERYVPAGSAEAAAAAPFVEWARDLSWETYKKMILELEKRGPTLIDHDFDLATIKAACE